MSERRKKTGLTRIPPGRIDLVVRKIQLDIWLEEQGVPKAKRIEMLKRYIAVNNRREPQR